MAQRTLFSALITGEYQYIAYDDANEGNQPEARAAVPQLHRWIRRPSSAARLVADTTLRSEAACSSPTCNLKGDRISCFTDTKVTILTAQSEVEAYQNLG